MKKTILATAILSSVLGLSQVHAADSGLTLYGVVDVGYKYSKTTTENGLSAGAQRKSTTEMMSGHQSTSHFGLMGTEKISPGLTANFALEAGFDADTGQSTGTLFNRQAWVGLGTPYGEVRLGRQEHVTSLLTSSIDPFDNAFGDAAIGAVYSDNIYFFTPQAHDRLNNAVSYLGSFMNDTLKVGANFSTADKGQEVAGTGNNSRWFGIAANYTWRDLTIAASYDRNLLPNGEMDTNGDYVSFGHKRNLDYWSLGATYDFKVVKLHAGYYREGTLKDSGHTTGHGNTWLVGASAPIGSNQKLMASYKRGRDISHEDLDLDSYAIGYTYDFSKRTNLYASYTHTKISTSDAPTDWKRDELAMGVRHSF